MKFPFIDSDGQMKTQRNKIKIMVQGVVIGEVMDFDLSPKMVPVQIRGANER